MSFIDTHKGYQKYKEDPLVLLLMKYFKTNTATFQIPPVWKSFIEKSTDATDINLLLSQLRNWNIDEEIDANLRGTDLLNAIYDSRLRALFKEADANAATKKVSWNVALENTFIRRGFVPSIEKRQLLPKGFASINCDLRFTETGTVTYEVDRRIPNVQSLIPSQWILANCSPEITDPVMLKRFLHDFSRGFPPEEVRQNGGFSLRAWFKKIFCYTDLAKWDPETMASSMESFFPARLNGSLHDDEQQFYFTVLSHKPDEIKTDQDVEKRNVQLSFSRDRRGSPRPTVIDFPAFLPETWADAAKKGINLPPPSRSFDGRPTFYFEDGNDRGPETGYQLARGLRSIYSELAKATEYELLRKKALDK